MLVLVLGCSGARICLGLHFNILVLLPFSMPGEWGYFCYGCVGARRLRQRRSSERIQLNSPLRSRGDYRLTQS
jgi:hypothetical protein